MLGITWVALGNVKAWVFFPANVGENVVKKSMRALRGADQACSRKLADELEVA